MVFGFCFLPPMVCASWWSVIFHRVIEYPPLMAAGLTGRVDFIFGG
jgi:hypothetical protein